MDREKLSELYKYITNRRSIVLVGHVNPDGDSIGSLCGMREFLRENNISSTAIVPNRYPDFLAFLDSGGDILSYRDDRESVDVVIGKADLIICLDFNSMKRIDELGEAIGGSSADKVLIDHHLSPDNSFNLIFSQIEVSSTCELLYYVLKELTEIFPLKKMTKECAVPLYTGMMTDTNNFANSVRPETFRMAYELLELGVDKEMVQFKVFSGFSESRMRLMGYMLNERMEILPEINAAIMILTKECKERFNFSDGDSEGFVNLALNIKGVNVSALFTEADEFVRVSLRSKEGFSVNALARRFFNGGGHEKAAGGKLFMPVDAVREYFVDSMKRYIEESL